LKKSTDKLWKNVTCRLTWSTHDTEIVTTRSSFKMMVRSNSSNFF